MHTYTLQSMCDGRFTPLLACPSAMMIVPSPREPAIIAHWHEMHWMDHCRAESRASPRSNRYLPSATYTTYAWTGALQLENSLHKSRASREPAWPAALQAYSSSRATWRTRAPWV